MSYFCSKGACSRNTTTKMTANTRAGCRLDRMEKLFYPQRDCLPGSLLVAAIGLYAVVAFNMARRTRDFGVRIALGASPIQIRGMVIREGLLMTAGGLACGFGLSAAAGGVLRSRLAGVTQTDLHTYAGVFALLASAALLACYVPARRTARVSPMEALRQE